MWVPTLDSTTRASSYICVVLHRCPPVLHRFSTPLSTGRPLFVMIHKEMPCGLWLGRVAACRGVSNSRLSISFRRPKPAWREEQQAVLALGVAALCVAQHRPAVRTLWLLRLPCPEAALPPRPALTASLRGNCHRSCDYCPGRDPLARPLELPRPVARLRHGEGPAGWRRKIA